MRILAVVLIASLLAGCGYHPLYGDHTDSASSAELANIYVAGIPNREGQILRNYLIERLSDNAQPGYPTHTLTISLRIQSTGIALSRDNTTSRTNITATANFVLVDSAANRPVLKGVSRATTSYDVLLSDYATLVSREDAENRTLREVSDDLRTRLAVYLSDLKARGPEAA